MSKWMYHSDDNVYYQIGISYCETPADDSYETLAVFVPGDYFSGTDNGDGTYTCELSSDAKVNGYTSQTAPIVMPIETPGYSAQAALTGYTSLTEYMEAGFVYVHAGCRGRDVGAPAGVTDIKAAIRYLRYIDDVAPGDAEKIFVFGMSGGRGENGDFGGFGGPDSTKEGSYEELDDITRTETSNGITISGIYETASDYIDALNADGTWVTYDAETNTAAITSVSDFVKAFKSVSKNLGAFDQLDAGQGENVLFGYGDGKGAHFDAMLADILNELESSYAPDFEEDLQKTDAVGYTVAQRLNMYTPLYYLLESEDGYRTSTPAKYWRIRTGIAQSDTSLTTEVNLALALENYDGVESVDFATVWGQQHVKAERVGNSTTNFIAWVNECMK